MSGAERKPQLTPPPPLPARPQGSGWDVNAPDGATCFDMAKAAGNEHTLRVLQEIEDHKVVKKVREERAAGNPDFPNPTPLPQPRRLRTLEELEALTFGPPPHIIADIRARRMMKNHDDRDI